MRHPAMAGFAQVMAAVASERPMAQKLRGQFDEGGRHRIQVPHPASAEWTFEPQAQPSMVLPEVLGDEVNDGWLGQHPVFRG